MTPEDKVTGYNNFYEFGLDKADPAANAGGLKTEGWKVRIDGEVAKPITLDIDDLMKRFPLEQRIYRMRCVEAGRWWCRGSASNWASFSSWPSRTATRATWPSRRCTIRSRCPARKIALSVAA